MVECNVMPENNQRKPHYQLSKKIVTYDLRPSTIFGKALAFSFGLLFLIVIFFFSIAIFLVLLTAILLFVGYARWASPRNSKNDKSIFIENQKNNGENT
jgi:ABC-type bacteriocin/lantibiotic exporter with double-glycine peptidase domain